MILISGLVEIMCSSLCRDFDVIYVLHIEII